MTRFSQTLFVLLVLTPAVWAQDLTAINLPSNGASALQSAAKAAGLNWKGGSRAAKTFTGSIVAWEAQAGSGTEITPENATTLAEYVRQGGSLLLTLSSDPGTGPFRLSFMLPSTAWHTIGKGANNAAKNSGPVTLTQTNSSLFPGTPPALTVPFAFPIRPFHAVERGEARYERFQRPILSIDQNLPTNNNFWTRPLINRDWQIRARGNDVGQSPLLLTGRYGAGRVALFASSAHDMADSPAASTFWTPVLKWLAEKETPVATTTAQLKTPVIQVHAPTREMDITVWNPSDTPLPVQILTRLSTWENAPVGDITRNLVLAPNSQTAFPLQLPKAGTTGYQALDYRDAFKARIGILGANGATVLAETQAVVDLRLPLKISVATDNLRAIPYPFKAPGPDMVNFPSRMGTEINAYAYPPGQVVNAQVTIGNGVRNLAPLAAVHDETKPDNPSTPALNDEAAHAEQGPNTDKIQAYGAWTGTANQENVLSFTFPSNVQISGVTLMGSADNFRNQLSRNPGAVTIEIDGHEVAHEDGLDTKFTARFGQVRLAFEPKFGRVVRVRLPWVNQPIPTPSGERRREAPWLGEIHIEGSTDTLPTAAQGTLSLALRDSFTGALTPVGSKTINIKPGALERLYFPVTVPNTGAAPRFYTLEASFAGQNAQTGFMTIQPTQPLAPLKMLKPASAPDLGFIVTRGFRNVLETGTGTAEIPPNSWATPDDLIWAYSHQMKQLGANSRTQANRLFLTENDMRHYSTPWRDFPNGEYFYDLAPELLIQRMKRDPRWNGSDVVILSHSDRWDSAPDVDALHGWQDFIGFDEYLTGQGGAGLKGRTRQELTDEVHAKYEHQWQAYHLERYAKAVSNLRNAFAKEGKRVIMTAQGSPLVPAKYESALTDVIRGQSDDYTWGMIEENPTLTVGRQMGILAFNPGWAMSTLIQWGWDSGILGNPHWHQPVGTTEPSRRHIYDRAWRGTIGWDGRYKSIHAYGYNTNGGVSFTMTPNDWRQWWDVEERHSLIAPEAPLGAGLIISTARFADPKRTSWSGSGGSGKSEADDQVRTVQRALRAFQDAGFSIPFAANAGTLANWKADTPLILLDLSNFSTEEIATLAQLKARGVSLIAFKGPGDLPAPATALFGVKPDGTPAQGRQSGDLNGRPVVSGTNTLLIAARADDFSVDAARALAPLLKQSLNLPLTFPAGTSGYGFVSQGKKFIVLEDWREEGRQVQVRLRAVANARVARAVDVNSHRNLTVRRDGGDWVIELSTRPGDGTLIAVDEEVAP